MRLVLVLRFCVTLQLHSQLLPTHAAKQPIGSTLDLL